MFIDADRPRYERAAVRWHGRLCTEQALSLEEAQLVLAALHALPAAGAAALVQVCETRGLREVADVIDAWLHTRAAP
ncbi:MAG: hypothetical protein JOZ25_12860 [Actinobacteria bacterium]|nr:hypothetical protein [Actinomycetota bacterium]